MAGPEPDTSTGPHLVVAALCEKVLQEQDGVLSLIRLIDALTQTASGVETPAQMPPFIATDLTMVISVKADQARGRFGIRVRPEAPSGVQLPAIEQGVNLQPGAAKGINLVMPLQIAIDQEGTYWFDVFLTGPAPQAARLLTRVPLNIIYQPQQLGG
jgi:hypothetical protein